MATWKVEFVLNTEKTRESLWIGHLVSQVASRSVRRVPVALRFIVAPAVSAPLGA